MDVVSHLFILFIVTSQPTMGDNGEPTGAWLEEVAAPYYAFTEAGYDVIVVSPQGGQMPIDPRSLEDDALTPEAQRFLKDKQAQKLFNNTLPLADTPPHDYAAVFIPGGHGPMWDLADNKRVGELLEAFNALGKPIGAVCHGPAALLPAKDKSGKWVFADRKMTGFSNSEELTVGLTDVVPFLLEDKLVEQGGTYTRVKKFEPNVIVDENLVTGQNPASSKPAAQAVLELIND